MFDDFFNAIAGNVVLRRALEVACVGGHTVGLCGNADDFPVPVPAAFSPVVCRMALVAPCPCGNLRSPRPCSCRPGQIRRYQQGDDYRHLLTADILVEIVSPTFEEAMRHEPEEPWDIVLPRILEAQKRPIPLLPAPPAGRRLAAIDFLKTAYTHLAMTPRRLRQVCAVAGSIARLAAADQIRVEHVAEAAQYGRLPV